ncbi:MAG TPA: glycosyltransferase family 1 protein, partial [Candidatus Dormibacteraeota bacterium]|nr:glycosyltransferase family 1 protein [Candidatus Dormibacteraeota bacterium]
MSWTVEVDGSGLARPRAGVGVYTVEVLLAMAELFGEGHFRVHLPSGVTAPAVASWETRRIPGPRLLGRHWRWPKQLNRETAAYFGPAGQLPLGRMSIPTAITVHDLAIYRNPKWFPPRQPLSTRLIVPRSLARADVIISPSRSTASDLAELFGIGPDRVRIIPHGVASRFRPGSHDLALRRRLGLPAQFILFVGTIEPRKNLATLVQAVLELPGRPTLVVAGNWGWGYEVDRRLMERAGDRVRILGDLDPIELPSLYNLASVLAHPAWYEGFGFTPLEAMACGIPVVVSNSSSLPEVVGDAARLVPPDDVDGWKSALEEVLTDPEVATDLRRRGISRARDFT